MQQTDAELIQRMARGDHEACRVLYGRWAYKIRAYAGQRLWWRPCDDDDVVQEVMLRVWRAAPDYMPTNNDGRRWVWRIVRNLVLDWAKAYECQTRCYQRLDTTELSQSPNNDLESDDATVALWHRIAHSGWVSPTQKDCLRAVYDSPEASLYEIARARGMNVNTFKAHLCRGRQAAQRVLAGRSRL